MTENEIVKIILDAAFDIHRELGTGLYETVYEPIMEYELIHTHKLKVSRQEAVPVFWKGMQMKAAFKVDLLVEDKVLVELKSVETLLPIHQKQVLNYLRLTGLKLGILINFNAEYLKDGIKRIVNNL